jgi:hypothetical protein
MVVPPQVLFRNSKPTMDVDTQIRQELAALEKFYSRIMTCRVEVEAPEHHRRGSEYNIRIDLGVPRERVAKTEPSPSAGTQVQHRAQHLEVKARNKDVHLAIHGGFKIARRRLGNYSANRGT